MGQKIYPLIRDKDGNSVFWIDFADVAYVQKTTLDDPSYRADGTIIFFKYSIKVENPYSHNNYPNDIPKYIKEQFNIWTATPAEIIVEAWEQSKI